MRGGFFIPIVIKLDHCLTCLGYATASFKVLSYQQYLSIIDNDKWLDVCRYSIG